MHRTPLYTVIKMNSFRVKLDLLLEKGAEIDKRIKGEHAFEKARTLLECYLFISWEWENEEVIEVS